MKAFSTASLFIIATAYAVMKLQYVPRKSHQFWSIKSQESQGSESIFPADAMFYNVLGVILIFLVSSKSQHCQGTQANLEKFHICTSILYCCNSIKWNS